MITTTRVWNIDNQLVVADTIEEAIAIRKEYNKEYYSHNEINKVEGVFAENCLTTLTLAIKRD